jgi:predicted house-cleaning NTP pyrophosphatase (Maf/HAM1 superfamily)
VNSLEIENTEIMGKPKTKKKARKTIQKTSMFPLQVSKPLFSSNF